MNWYSKLPFECNVAHGYFQNVTLLKWPQKNHCKTHCTSPILQGNRIKLHIRTITLSVSRGWKTCLQHTHIHFSDTLIRHWMKTLKICFGCTLFLKRHNIDIYTNVFSSRKPHPFYSLNLSWSLILYPKEMNWIIFSTLLERWQFWIIGYCWTP